MALDPLWMDASAGSPAYTAQEIRMGLAAFATGAGASLGVRSGVRQSGSGTDFLVQQQTVANMSVKVNPGVFIAQGAISTTQGPYTYALDAVTTVTISAAHATLSRTDLIVIRIRDANVDTSGQRDGGVTVVTGTAGGGVPSLPTDASYFEIARVAVGAAATSITSANISDKRLYTAALGGVIPFVSTARPTGLPDGVPGYELDTGYSYRWKSSTSKWLREQTWVVRTTDGSNITSNTTLANDPVLFVPMEANGIYQFKMVIGAIAGTGNGLKLALTFPTGAILDYRQEGRAVADTWYENWVGNAGSGATTVWGSSAGGSGIAPIFEGVCQNGSTAGNLQLQAAQGTSSGTAVAIVKGAHIIYKQIA